MTLNLFVECRMKTWFRNRNDNYSIRQTPCFWKKKWKMRFKWDSWRKGFWVVVWVHQTSSVIIYADRKRNRKRICRKVEESLNIRILLSVLLRTWSAYSRNVKCRQNFSYLSSRLTIVYFAREECLNIWMVSWTISRNFPSSDSSHLCQLKTRWKNNF